MKTPYWLFPWNFKKKITNHFLWHSLEKAFPALCALLGNGSGWAALRERKGKSFSPLPNTFH